ncbi:CGNR zinc finger domain-containing protein [Halobacillus litoralis]|uniref:CGNR zinc finger domain-containing protein n=1 Tax=Halobacillus litoralis TaxID=45668 RepID=UPI00136E9929|nr:CGNR zinc finger domain-containing protein [Halobacillus litoralis]
MQDQMTFSHFSSYVFINFFNTINSRRDQANDYLTMEQGGDEWLDLMGKHRLLTDQQVEAVKRGPFHIEKLRSFRDQSRSYFYNRENEEALTHMLSEWTKGSLQFIFDQDALVPVPLKGGSDGLLAILAYQMLHHKEAGIWEKVSACQNDDCLALFVNQKGRRKWCSMDVCGNRMKARKHYSKKKAGQPAE